MIWFTDMEALSYFPKKNLLEVEEFKVDMTTSIGAKFVLQI